MSLPIGSNFSYKGKLPNFDRDSFKTLADMKAVADNIMDEGHISFCEETGKHYVFNSSNSIDEILGKWRLFGGTGEIDEETLKKLTIAYELSSNNPDYDSNTSDIDIDGNDDSVNIDGGNFIESVNKYDLDKKVDKVPNKGLSTNDFSDKYKSELDAIISGGVLSDKDKAKIATIDNKVDKVDGKSLSTNDFTDAYKTLLDSLTISDAEYNTLMNDMLGTNNENYI